LTDARDIADADDGLHLMPMELFRTLIVSMAEAGVKSVFLTGGGEPLLNPNLPLMAEEVRAAGMAWGLFTNGWTLTPKLAERLLRAQPGFFRVSIDAGNPSLYSKVYAADPKMFEVAKANVVAAGKIAAGLGYSWFGVGFAVMPNVSRADVVDMRDTFLELCEKSDLGVNLASFRPRVIHHHDDQVVVPQKYSGRYQAPVKARYGDRVRIDHKFGAFTDCDREESPQGGWGGSWLATLDHLASGSIVSHLTGSSNNPSSWGSALAGGGFLSAWHSEKRRSAQQLVIDGKIKLPIANGFRSLDAFLERVKTVFPAPLDEHVADEFMEGISEWGFYRSRRPEFVG
jgi:hypothetical protein